MSQRSLYVVLFVSLAVNLFVVGAVVGAIVLGAHFHNMMGRSLRGGGGPMMAAARSLPPDQAEAFRDALRVGAASVAPQVRQARQLRRGALQRLGAQPLDTAGIIKDLDQARALEAQARGEVDHRIVDFASRLPPDQRARLGEALAQPPPRRGGGPPPP